ncbi:tail fiber protein [Erythrobacter sp. SDW2]|uniref:phage tail protein n=1 Tax=Erythrobacter sp. SDW2 TaxID=2907154 RepID=UPI001F39947F|nr:tail fiber protein [Erythrobacter sp. SDW2]UIP06158.1 tail fiber protein [Erythrobacter sp. SDW2]
MSFAEPTIGEIQMFAGDFAPRNFALCQGQLLPISQNSALFSILGTTFGGDGRTTFGLPDLRSRVPRHAGQGPGLGNVRLGEQGGLEYEAVGPINLPTHSHPHSHLASVHAEPRLGDENAPGDNVFALTPPGTNIYHDVDDTRQDILMHANTVTLSQDMTPAGGNQSFYAVNPYLGVNYIIALYGIYPSRS